jgi:quercetin dioxygenase-like cupin family protein
MTYLEHFAKLFLSGEIKPNVNEFSGQVIVTDSTSSTIIFANGYFMVEQYHLFPNTTTPQHSHPFSSLTVYQGGELTAKRNNNKEYIYSDKDCYDVGSELPPGEQHGFTVGARGATVLVFSQWTTLKDRMSAVLKYQGTAMGPKHEQLLKEFA